MNAISRIAAVAFTLVAAGSAFADDITIDSAKHQSLKSRSDVQTELAQYRQAGVNPWSTSYNPFKAQPSVRARADVVAETRSAIASGDINAYSGEDSGSSYLAAHRPAKSTGQILAAR